MEKTKKIVTKILWAFALISIGFALGRNSATRKTIEVEADTSQKVISARHLVVYYTHATARCVTCKNIQKTTHAILEKDFKNELDSGTIQWKVVNFQTDEAFAKKFDVAANGVVLAVINGDKVEKIEKLEEIWTLIDKPLEFKSYIEKSVKECLE